MNHLEPWNYCGYYEALEQIFSLERYIQVSKEAHALFSEAVQEKLLPKPAVQMHQNNKNYKFKQNEKFLHNFRPLSATVLQPKNDRFLQKIKAMFQKMI